MTVHLDDESARMVAEAALAAKQPLEQWLRENLRQAATRSLSGAKAVEGRISPLHPGAMQPAADFNAPLAEFTLHV